MSVKKIAIITITTLLSIIIISQSIFSIESLNKYEYLKLQIENNISFDIKKENSFKIESFKLSSFFFPQNYKDSQYLNKFQTTNTQYSIINSSGTLYPMFSYTSKTLKDKNTIKNTFIVESTTNKPKIRKIISYPIENTKQEDKEFLEFVGLIDIDENIKKQASDLANGEKDVFIISSKIAKWIKEDINYDLTTVAQNPNQKSTDVFQSKAGVCKEITQLYISMLRSIGIPARIVTGYAYTTSEEIINYVGDPWGGHAWAEVLIGDEWVPFDLTYDQYGFVDSTHIVLDKSKQIRESSLTINASAYAISIVPNTLKTSTKFEVLDKIENLYDPGFNIQISGPDKLGSQSYGYIKAQITNEKDYYQILFLRLAKTKEIELLDQDEKMIIFKPNEKKEIYFRYKLPTLSPGYTYTFPFTIYNQFIEETINIQGQSTYMKIKEIALPQDEEEIKEFSDNSLKLNCSMKLNSPLNLINCSIKNPNNYQIDNLNICTTQNCVATELKINEEKYIYLKTPKFSEIINYYYNQSKGEIKVFLQKPILNTTYSINNQEITIKTNIKNFEEGIKTNIYIDNQLVETSSKKTDTKSIQVTKGNHTLKLEILFKTISLQNSTAIFTIKEINDQTDKKTTQENNNLNFLQKIIDWIKNLFN